MTDTVPVDVYERDPAASNGHRTLASNATLERHVLHLALVHGLTAELEDAGLRAEHFVSDRRRSVWQAAAEARAAGHVVDVHTIRPWLPTTVEEPDLVEIVADTIPSVGRGPEWVAELGRLTDERRFDLAVEDVRTARAGGLPVADARALLTPLVGATPADLSTSWEPIDLRPALAGERPPPPVVFAHRRGHRLLYAGRMHTFQGPSESCKSWAAQAAVAEVLGEGEQVLFVDFEDDEAGVVERLVALGATEDQILGQLVYVRPDEPLIDRQDRYTRAGLRFQELLTERPWSLAILDGVTEAMTTEGLELNDNADAARFSRRILRPMAETGAAALAIDHVTKNAEGGRHALGAQHKLAGLTGASFRFDPERPLGRAIGTEPVVGVVKVTVTKDRPGHVRAHAPDGQVGKLRITAWPDGGVDVELVDPADLGDDSADMVLAGRILSYLVTYNGASKNKLEEDVTGKREGIRAALTWMVGKQWIEVRKEGQSHRHYLTEAGRAETPE